MDINEIKKDLKGEKLQENSVVEKKPEEAVELKENLEQKEILKDELEHKEIRKEIEKMDLDDGLKAQSQSTAQGMKDLKAEEKIKQLLKLAKDKGVIFAVQTAKKMDDPYILDMLHDALAKEGLYKEFLK